MERRVFLALVPTSLLAAPLAAQAQQAGKVWQIGFLGSGTPTGWGGPGIEAIRLGLRDHGYVEGRNIRIEMVINLRTAKTLGVTIPASVLALADQVIE